MGVQVSKVEGTLHLSIRESARRLLRYDVIKFRVPNEFSEKCHNLILDVSDLQPSQLLEPVIEEEVSLGLVEFFDSEGKLVQLSGNEPEESICWIPGVLEDIWIEFEKYAKALAEAGYPGCLNCGGRDAGEVWDEASRRLEMANSS